jgi:hypothetical protein
MLNLHLSELHVVMYLVHSVLVPIQPGQCLRSVAEIRLIGVKAKIARVVQRLSQGNACETKLLGPIGKVLLEGHSEHHVPEETR